MNTNWKRIGKVSLLAVTLSGMLVGLAAYAGEHGRGFGRHMIQARIDAILDQLQATPEQRQQISAVTSKVIADLETKRQAHQAIMKELKAQIAQDTVSFTAFDQLVQAQRQADDAFQADLRATIQQVHDTLAPAQRAQLSQLKMHHGGFEQEKGEAVQ